MKRILGVWGIPLVIALTCIGILQILQWWRPFVVVPLDIAAGDFLLLREDGPHLGRRAARDDIVLVLIDLPTVLERDGRVPSWDEDLQLYRNLFAAGVRVVADTHMMAAADENAMQEVLPLLQGMLQLRDDGALMRDLWTPITTSPEDLDRWAPCIAPVVTNMHPSAYRIFETRLWPLAIYMHSGPVETMPLRIVRAWKQTPRVDCTVVNAELERCGIFTSWSEPRAAEEYRSSSPPNYQLSGISVPWNEFPSNSTLVPPVGFWISYDAPPSHFPRFSYQDVLQGRVSKPLAGKIVIVGTDAQIDPTEQTFTIPTGLEKVSIAEVVGAAVHTLLEERFLRTLPWGLRLVVALLLVASLTMVGVHLRPLPAFLVGALILTGYIGIAAVAYRQGWLMSMLLLPVTAITAGVCGGAYQLFLTRRARSRIVDLFGRYVPRAVVQQLVQKPELETLVVGGIRREVSVLFADVRGFTTFSENLSPEAVLTQLNSLLDGMVACTFAAEGTLDKFIGDAILVLFNAPLEQPDHVRRAVTTALQIQTRLAHHPSDLKIGIGIHTGEAVVGNIGTPERMEYTAIGSTVNIASRLCDAAKPGEIVVSAAVAEKLAGQFDFETRPSIRVKGIDRELPIVVVRGQTATRATS